MLLLANNTFSFFFLQIGFVEVHADDGYLEIFGLKQGWHASIIMVDLISVKHIAQVLHLLSIHATSFFNSKVRTK